MLYFFIVYTTLKSFCIGLNRNWGLTISRLYGLCVISSFSCLDRSKVPFSDKPQTYVLWRGKVTLSTQLYWIIGQLQRPISAFRLYTVCTRDLKSALSLSGLTQQHCYNDLKQDYVPKCCFVPTLHHMSGDRQEHVKICKLSNYVRPLIYSANLPNQNGAT